MAMASSGGGRTAGDWVVLLVAVLLGAFGFVMICGVLIGALEGDSSYSPATNAMFGLLLGVLPLVAAVLLHARNHRARARRAADGLEAAVLRLAAERGGVVTPVDVAATTGASLEQARATLDRLHLRAFCAIELSDAGTETYRFGAER